MDFMIAKRRADVALQSLSEEWSAAKALLFDKAAEAQQLAASKIIEAAE